jgi:nucleotide-binding universal stress UspA family protein
MARSPRFQGSYHPLRPLKQRHVLPLLTPTDFSAPANQAVTAAVELAQTFGATLTVLHVVEPPSYLVDSHASAHQGPILPKALEEQARQELDHLLSLIPEARVEITRRVIVGVPYQQIIESAPAGPVDLIVMATHGRTGLRHLVLGSVAERVVRLAPCPVLTIRPPGERAVASAPGWWDRRATPLAIPSYWRPSVSAGCADLLHNC